MQKLLRRQNQERGKNKKKTSHAPHTFELDPNYRGDVSEFSEDFDENFINMMGQQFQMNPADEYERGNLKKCLVNLKELIRQRQMVSIIL